MGCTNAKAAGAEDGGPGGLRSSTSAIKGGVQSQEVKERKLSISFTSQELNVAPEGGEGAPTERASAQFEPRRIGTHTLHGVMPGPKKGSAKAKVNQDRGSVVWPFAGSYNEALLCIFDGHGSRGERASEFCMTRLPQVLEFMRSEVGARLLGTDAGAVVAHEVLACMEKLSKAFVTLEQDHARIAAEKDAAKHGEKASKPPMRPTTPLPPASLAAGAEQHKPLSPLSAGRPTSAAGASAEDGAERPACPVVPPTATALAAASAVFSLSGSRTLSAALK